MLEKENLAVVDSIVDILLGDFHNMPYPRDPKDNGKYMHLVAGIFIYDINLKSYLLQKRSSTKNWYPNHFTDSASGHITAKRDLTLSKIKDEMCRELYEEMGIKLKPEHLRFWTLFFDPEFNEIKFVFIAAHDDEQKLSIDPQEVAKGSGWYKEDELRELLENYPFVPPVRDLWKEFIKKSHQFQIFFNILDQWQEFWTFFDGLRDFKLWQKHSPAQTPGFFIGRFQPFHLGHLECLKKIQDSHSTIIIGIGSAQYKRMDRNPLGYFERKDIITNIIEEEGLQFSHAFIIPFPDIHCEELWMLNVRLLVGHNVVFYSNNDWVRGLAVDQGMQVAAKLDYKMSKYNGTRIREKIKKKENWTHLVPQSCAHYLKEKNLIEKF